MKNYAYYSATLYSIYKMGVLYFNYKYYISMLDYCIVSDIYCQQVQKNKQKQY